nr:MULTISPECIES: BlaI/MecI/CopY family transcriptional regulator [unclassified Dysgonomonas]
MIMEIDLTKLELKLMNILWDKEKAFVNDIIEILPEPKPAYTTISTMMRILVKKGYVAYNAFGKSHQYYPLIHKEDYTHTLLQNTKDNLFGGSLKSMISFFAESEKLSSAEIEELIEILNSTK